MKVSKLLALLLTLSVGLELSSCSKTHNDTTATANNAAQSKDTINVDNGDDAPTVDPVMVQDTTGARVSYDLFTGLVDFNQKNETIPGLAEKWDISPDGKVYTFHLRNGIKFSDGTPITADDVVFTWQRVADPKIASPYNLLVSNVVNGQAIIDGKAAVNTLGVKALNKNTIQITLNNPDTAFLQICTMPNVGIVSKANLTKFGTQWTDPKNMVTSGAYTIKEWVLKGHMLLTKNPYYYDVKNVTIPNVNFLPLVDTNASLSQYRTNGVDVTSTIPVDQYKEIQKEFGSQLHQFTLEGLAYYDFNMTLPKYANNKDLRQALSMAIDRQILTKEVLGQGQVPSYSFITTTVEGGKFAGLDYDWAKLPRNQQIAMAKELFAKAGYGPNHPLEISIAYNTNDGNKKVSIALGAMWEEVFGTDSIKVTQANQEWKTFIDTRNKANYDIARDAWSADYNSANNYTILYSCNNPQNNAKYCNPAYNKLIDQAQQTTDADKRIDLIRQAIMLAESDYAVIPLYQYTGQRLVNQRVKGYDPENNHFDHVQSKWYHF